MVEIIELVNSRTNISLGRKIGVAKTFSQRFIGLLGRSGLKPEEGLLLDRCNQVHMLFMRFEIGLLFLSPEFIIVGIESSIKPWKVSKVVSEAYSVLELPVGVIERAACDYGDQIIRI
jgi:uncharacterized membrane protein (UPF0127 family)